MNPPTRAQLISGLVRAERVLRDAAADVRLPGPMRFGLLRCANSLARLIKRARRGK